MAAAGVPAKKSKSAAAASSKGRRSRKKRRTEISSSEEGSSSGEDEEEEKELQKDASDAAAETSMDVEETTQLGDMEIEHLQVGGSRRQTADKTAADVVQTRLKLRQTDTLDIASAGTAAGGDGETGPSSDDWLKLMLAEYGDDIDTLRKSAGDFRGESVTLVAELLRATKDVFREV